MNSDKFTVINEEGKESTASIITAFTYKEKDYAIYSIDKDAEDTNIYVSRLSKDNNGYDTICDIEDEIEREEVFSVVKEILSSVK